MKWLRWFTRPDDRVSAQWIAERHRAECRNTFIGVSWKWPIKKQQDDLAWRNRQRLRRAS